MGRAALLLLLAGNGKRLVAVIEVGMARGGYFAFSPCFCGSACVGAIRGGSFAPWEGLEPVAWLFGGCGGREALRAAPPCFVMVAVAEEGLLLVVFEVRCLFLRPLALLFPPPPPTVGFGQARGRYDPGSRLWYPVVGEEEGADL